MHPRRAFRVLVAQALVLAHPAQGRVRERIGAVGNLPLAGQSLVLQFLEQGGQLALGHAAVAWRGRGAEGKRLAGSQGGV
jgi:hypothetical protein